MVKEKYTRTELEIIRFMTADVITTSNPDEYEGWNPHSSGSSGSGSSDVYEGWMPH